MGIKSNAWRNKLYLNRDGSAALLMSSFFGTTLVIIGSDGYIKFTHEYLVRDYESFAGTRSAAVAWLATRDYTSRRITDEQYYEACARVRAAYCNNLAIDLLDE